MHYVPKTREGTGQSETFLSPDFAVVCSQECFALYMPFSLITATVATPDTLLQIYFFVSSTSSVTKTSYRGKFEAIHSQCLSRVCTSERMLLSYLVDDTSFRDDGPSNG